MRKKRKKATLVIVDGVVHAIGDVSNFDLACEGNGPWGAWGEYPLHGRRTRAQRKADKAKTLRDRADRMVRLACSGFRYEWRKAPHTHAAVTCMTCLVALARMDR